MLVLIECVSITDYYLWRVPIIAHEKTNMIPLLLQKTRLAVAAPKWQ